MAKAYIALGSNLGDRRANIKKAMEGISRLKGTEILRRSSLCETEPFGGPPQARYLNSVIAVETKLEPGRLLSGLQDIEYMLGRRRGTRGGPRTIDLDILFYGGRVIKTKRLTIPHPRLHERDFVLTPLKKIAPNLVHPGLNQTVAVMAKKKRVEVFRSPDALQARIVGLKRKGKSVGFVPTMGYLHEGHLSLIRRGLRECDAVVVSIFVNPIQFGPGEDYGRYPRDFRRDLRMCEGVGADMIFYPDAKTMYPGGFCTSVEVSGLTAGLCGRLRPGHFTGVATVVAKLLNIVSPTAAYFGQKDAQQAFVIRRMARDLNMPVRITICPTVREDDGLAMSSRNIYLTESERRQAPALYRSLMFARKMIKAGERDASKIVSAMKGFIRSRTDAEIEHVSIVDTGALREMKAVKGRALIALAARLGKARLIDNIIVKA